MKFCLELSIPQYHLTAICEPNISTEEKVALIVAVLVPALGFAFVVATVSAVVCYWINMTARYNDIPSLNHRANPIFTL